MPKPEPGNVHYVPVGKFGVVAHSMHRHELMAWTRAMTSPVPVPRYWLTIPKVNSFYLRLSGHIPHGTFVLVLEEPVSLGKVESREDYFFYHVLWGELDCWIRTDYLLNPYVAGIPCDER